MKVSFVTPTRMSLMDITSMGGSEKRGDETKFGTFCSGLKYAIALLLRDNVKINISVYGGTEAFGDEDRQFTERYFFDTFIQECSSTGKTKELIKVLKTTEKESFHSHHCEDLGGGEFEEEFETGFAKDLGFNWELWMALRELWSNAVDEGGYTVEGEGEVPKYGTVVTLTFEEGVNEFFNVWKTKSDYIQEEFNFQVDSQLKMRRSETGYLQIYKRGILVYKDESKPTFHSYDISFGEIDERRTLSDVSSVLSEISTKLGYSTDEDIIREFMSDEELGENCLNSYGVWSISDTWTKVAKDIHGEFGKFHTLNCFIHSIQKHEDYDLENKTIRSMESSIYTYAKEVTVETIPQEIKEYGFKEKLESMYDFNLDVEVLESTLRGRKVIADKSKKLLIVDKDFDFEADFGALFIEYVDLTMTGNAIKNIGEFVSKKLRK